MRNEQAGKSQKAKSDTARLRNHTPLQSKASIKPSKCAISSAHSDICVRSTGDNVTIAAVTRHSLIGVKVVRRIGLEDYGASKNINIARNALRLGNVTRCC